MGIELDGYTTTGLLHATVDVAGRLADALEAAAPLRLTSGRLVPLDGSPRHDLAGTTLALDDLCLALAAADTAIPGHLAWHDLILAVGPWQVKGAMPTMYGFDQGRALARPQGTFVLLRDVGIGLLAHPDARDEAAFAWVNRYVVDRVEADLDLGFFFPGAEIVGDLGKVAAPPEAATS